MCVSSPMRRRRSPLDDANICSRFGIVTMGIYVGLGILASAAEKALEGMPEAKAKADDDDEHDDPFFPFPLTTKMVPQPPYAGSDPEWQQFVKVATDKALQENIRSRTSGTLGCVG